MQTGDIKAARLHVSDCEQTYNEVGLAQSRLWDPGTLCITIAANIAETAILGIRACFPDSVVGFMADPERADTLFIKYYVDFVKLEMQGLSHGTTQDNLSIEKLTSLEFRVPSPAIQRKIASTLSAYDELIENNLRRIKILEELAQSLYREWFVDFRFPGHKESRMVDSPLGLIPEGWKAVTLSEIGDLTIGGDWGEDAATGPEWREVYCLRGVDIHELKTTGFCTPRVRCVKEGSLQKRRVEPCDVVLEGSGECGRSLAGSKALDGLFDLPLIYSNFCKRIRFPNSVVAGYVERHLNTMVSSGEMNVYKTGTTIPNLNAKALFDTHLLVLPPADLLSAFGELAENLERLRLSGRNHLLSRTRDLLLPKLIAGELDVSELDIDVGWDAA